MWPGASRRKGGRRVQPWQPRLASRAGGIPEAVADGESGLLYDVGDGAGLEQQLLRLPHLPALHVQVRQVVQRGRHQLFEDPQGAIDGSIGVLLIVGFARRKEDGDLFQPRFDGAL